MALLTLQVMSMITILPAQGLICEKAADRKPTMANHDNTYQGFRPAAVLSAISPSNSGERTSHTSAALTRERTDGELGDE